MKKAVTVFAVLCMLTGFTGFVGGALISTGIIDYNKELPLGGINSIVVDSAENIYVGLEFYGKVQVYNRDGQFLRNWKVKASGGMFTIDMTKDQNILITTVRGSHRIFYDRNGKIISMETMDDGNSASSNAGGYLKNTSGARYEVSGLFPKIMRTAPDEKVIVSQGPLLQIMRGPLPSWILGALGVGLLLILHFDRLTNRMNKFKTG